MSMGTRRSRSARRALHSAFHETGHISPGNRPGTPREEHVGIDYRSADGVNGIEDIGLHDLRPSLALPRQRAWFVLAGPVDMIDVYFEFLDQRVELARLDDDGNPQPLEFLDSWTAGAQPADEDFEAGSVQVLRENLNRFLRPAN